MTDLRRLEHKMVRLAAPDEHIEADGRDIGAADRRGRLLAILQEIDETILPSALTFRNEIAGVLVLEVANRRLLRLNDDISPQTDERGEVLTAELVRVIEAFLAGTNALKISASRLDRQIGPDEIGCSSAMLAKEWGIDLYRNSPESLAERLDTFMEACSDFSSAWLRLDAPGIIQKSGTEEETGRLAALVEGDLSEMDRSLEKCAPDANDARCAILGTGDDGARSIAYIKADTSLALVMIASENVPEINALWQSIYQ